VPSSVVQRLYDSLCLGERAARSRARALPAARGWLLAAVARPHSLSQCAITIPRLLLAIGEGAPFSIPCHF